MNRWQTLTTEIVPFARGIARIYISTNCVRLFIVCVCVYLSDGQCKWSGCSRLKFMVIMVEVDGSPSGGDSASEGQG